MEQGSTPTEAADTGLFAGDAWFDPIEAGIRERVRGFIGVVQKPSFSGYTGVRRPPACEGRISTGDVSCAGGGWPPRGQARWG